MSVSMDQLRRTIEHNIEMESKYGIPPGSQDYGIDGVKGSGPKYKNPDDYWSSAKSVKRNPKGWGKAA